MIRSTLKPYAVIVCLLLSACATGGGSPVKQRDMALYDYASAIRWGEFDQAWMFVDPAVRAEHPLSALETERFKQVQVAGYDVKDSGETAEGELLQTVEIHLVNKFTQTERVITDHQRWRWDTAGKRWWLLSGLPNLDSP